MSQYGNGLAGAVGILVDCPTGHTTAAARSEAIYMAMFDGYRQYFTVGDKAPGVAIQRYDRPTPRCRIVRPPARP